MSFRAMLLTDCGRADLRIRIPVIVNRSVFYFLIQGSRDVCRSCEYCFMFYLDYKCEWCGDTFPPAPLVPLPWSALRGGLVLMVVCSCPASFWKCCVLPPTDWRGKTKNTVCVGTPTRAEAYNASDFVMETEIQPQCKANSACHAKVFLVLLIFH